jgi:hypothetical protein
MKKIFTLLSLLISLLGLSQSTTVVISQAYGGGGGSTGTYKFDYVELHNISSSTQSLTGMSLQYGSASGNFGATTSIVYAFPTGTSIPAGGYLLVQLGSAGSAGANLPVAADLVTTNLSMSGSSGKVALVNSTTGNVCGATATPCSLPNSLYIDVVSYGASNNGEGGTTVNNGTALTSTQGAVRKNNGCTETDNNNADFDVITAPVPRNSASPIFTCGAVPTLSASTLTTFGNVCINTTSTTTNSFTITGTNLTNANISVGPLSGYAFSTTAAGTYAPSLSLTQPGGSYSQQIFVQFTPTAVQSYNGNIPVNGGGVTTAINVAASGSGINDAPTVTTGAASSITQTSATLAGTISNTGCSAISAYGIEYSTTPGFANSTGTPVTASNLSTGNFSSNVAGLASGTTYYYHAYATNAGGTSYGAEQSFTTATPNPTLNVSSLASFGNICINNTSAANSFTITGTNLTNANVTVGPLAGYTFSTTAAGTYASTLSLTQPGGSYSQTIYIRFTPIAVQSYNGNIPVGGGGTTANVNVAATGAGVNTAATVLTGSASGITTTAGVLAGTITATGCSNVTAYGIEYSTTNNFANGTGTQVASANVSGGSFTSSLSGLTPSTTYYYKAYATNAGGTSYGAQQQFTTLAPPPPSISVTPLTAFGSNCVNNTVGPNSFTITGSNLTTANITVGPLAGYSFATTSGGTYTSTLTLTQTGGTYNQTVYVKFTPTAVQSYNGNIPVTGGGVTSTINVAASGSGANIPATVVTTTASNITNSSAILAGTISNTGCSNITAYGVEYSGVQNFTGGQGTKVFGSNLNGSNFSVAVSNLVQGATYYYRAFTTNSAGTSYGDIVSFTVASIPNVFTVYPTLATKGTQLRFSMTNLKAGYHAMIFYNSAGQKVYQKDYNVQGNFINEQLTVPASLAPGIYRVQLVNFESVIATKTISIL